MLKKQVKPGVIIGVISVAVLAIGLLAWNQFTGKPSSGTNPYSGDHATTDGKPPAGMKLTGQDGYSGGPSGGPYSGKGGPSGPPGGGYMSGPPPGTGYQSGPPPNSGGN